MEDYPKILQIIPASDWVVSYDDTEEILEPVACFALVEVTKDGDTYREVRAMVPDGKFMSFADEVSNFTGVRHATASDPR